MEKITIKKARLNSKGGMDVTYIDSSGNEKTLKSHNVTNAFQDTAFREMAPFLVYFTEQKEADSINWKDIEENGCIYPYPVSVRGVTVSVGDAGLKIQLLGQRTLVNDKVIDVNSPTIDLDTLQYDFPHYKDFSKKFDILQAEIANYVELADGRTGAKEEEE